MAQFRGILRGNRGETSRLGSKNSGIIANIDGWHGGVKVYACHNNGLDEFQVYVTGGSTGAEPQEHIATIVVDGGLHITTFGGFANESKN